MYGAYVVGNVAFFHVYLGLPVRFMRLQKPLRLQVYRVLASARRMTVPIKGDNRHLSQLDPHVPYRLQPSCMQILALRQPAENDGAATRSLRVPCIPCALFLSPRRCSLREQRFRADGLQSLDGPLR